jgi:hypothetical protein
MDGGVLATHCDRVATERRARFTMPRTQTVDAGRRRRRRREGRKRGSTKGIRERRPRERERECVCVCVCARGMMLDCACV